MSATKARARKRHELSQREHQRRERQRELANQEWRAWVAQKEAPRAPSVRDNGRRPQAPERLLPEHARPPLAPTLVDHADLRAIYGIKFSRVHLWRLIRAGRFPPPVSLYDGGIRKVWRSRDVEAWLAALPYVSNPGVAAE